MGSTQGTATLERASGREPPDDPPPAAEYVDARGNTPATTVVPATQPVPPVVCDDASVASVTNNTDSYDSINVNERSRQAFANALSRAQTSPRASIAPRQNVSPVRNPYPLTTPPQPTLRQTTILETIGRAPDRNVRVETSPHTRCDGDEPSSGASRPVVGGPIISPCHRDSDLRARHLGASRYNVVKLACPEYHIGLDGVPLLTEDILEARGFSQVTGNVEDVVMCYNNIILGHAKITKLWYNGYNHTSGPQVDKIIQKSLSVFPRLESTKVDDVVNFLRLPARGWTILCSGALAV
jgi:hypothetical protein